MSTRLARFDTVVRRLKRLIQRESAEQYLFLTLISFAGSVSITRLFLSVTNYPQVGGGELHIAHVLWGGLLLYIAALLPLLFANRTVYTIGALLAGAGVGLFIDEVGKFITQKNDYFFPIAASIIYVLFLLTIVLFIHARRVASTQLRDGLTSAFEDIWEALRQPLTPRQYKKLKSRLETAIKSAPSQRHASLAEALLAFLDADAAPDAASIDEVDELPARARRTVARLVSRPYLRAYLIVGLVAIGLLSLKNPVTVLLAPWLPAGLIAWLAGLHLGREVITSAASAWSSLRVALEVLVGFLLLASAGLLAAKRDRLGSALGYFSLLLSLTTVNILLFYYEQFSTIITTTVQFALLVGVALFRRQRV